MKKLIYTTILTIAFCFTAQAQDKVEVTQQFLDSASRCFDEIVACRETVERFKAERSLSIAERQAADALIKGLNELVAIKDRQIKAMEEYISFLEKRLNKKKTSFEKFLSGARKVLMISLGILIGRGLSF